MDKKALKQKWLDQRMREAYESGMRARQFTPQELLQQGDKLISNIIKLNRAIKHKLN